MRNDLTIYDTVADRWWSDDILWVRTLKNLVPGRMVWFDRQIDWQGKTVLDLGCAGGFMAEALAQRGADVSGIDPAAEAIDAARAHAREGGLRIGYDVGVGEALPYDDASFDAVVCVDVLEHVSDLNKVLSEVARTLRPGGLFLFDTINRNPLARLATITIAEDVLRLLPRGTHDPAMFIKPAELRAAMQGAGLVPGAVTGLGPRGFNRRFDLTFGPLPLTAVLYMGIARKPADMGSLAEPTCRAKTCSPTRGPQRLSRWRSALLSAWAARFWRTPPAPCGSWRRIMRRPITYHCRTSKPLCARRKAAAFASGRVSRAI